jgi:hypothetical protein
MPDIFVSEEEKITKENKKPVEEQRPDEVSKKVPMKEINKQEEKETIINSPIGPFSAFKVRPRGVHFNDQEEDEHVLLILRKHFATNILWMLFSILLLIIPPVFFNFFNLSDFFASLSIPQTTSFILFFAYYLVVFCYMFVAYITWYYNASLITNKKVVDVHFQDILYHDVSMTKLNLIEDVNYVQSGFFGSLFSYGDVYLETAGKAVRFDFLSVPNPERVANLLENLIGGQGSE